MRIISVPLYGLLALALASCSSLKIEQVNYGWPVEVVSKASDANIVTAERYGLSFSVSRIALEEFQDSSALAGSEVRVLRNHEGYYFVTGPRFKHVYVFSAGESRLNKESVIEISPTGLTKPAFNLRPPYVELLDSDGSRKLLTRSDIVEGNKQ